MNDDIRLANIEQKIDKLVEAFTKLAVVDERLTNLIENNSRNAARVAENESRIDKLEVKVATLSLIVSRIERLSYLVVTGVLGSLWKVFFGG